MSVRRRQEHRERATVRPYISVTWSKSASGAVLQHCFDAGCKAHNFHKVQEHPLCNSSRQGCIPCLPPELPNQLHPLSVSQVPFVPCSTIKDCSPLPRAATMRSAPISERLRWILVLINGFHRMLNAPWLHAEQPSRGPRQFASLLLTNSSMYFSSSLTHLIIFS